MSADNPTREPAVPLHEKELLDYDEVRALLGIPERTLNRLKGLGIIDGAIFRVGARVLFDRRVLKQRLAEYSARLEAERLKA